MKNNCLKCGEFRWQPEENSKRRGKKLPKKKLRYFPIIHKLQHMYSVPWIAKEIWHARVEDSSTHATPSKFSFLEEDR